MLKKQWLNNYLLNEGGSIIERCADRQRRRDRLEEQSTAILAAGFTMTITLQIALALFGFGVILYLIDISVILGLLCLIFYVSYSLFMILLIGVPRVMPFSRKVTLRRISLAPPTAVRHHSRSPSSPTTQSPPHNPLHLAPHLSQTQPPIRVGSPVVIVTSLWLESEALANPQEVNADDVWCVSWILWNIASSEALDTAICFAGTIRWFEDGLHVKPPYDLIVLVLKTCFDSSGRVCPRLRNRAYYSIRAIVWIQIHAMFVPEEFAPVPPLQTIPYDTTSLDPDLHDLLRIYNNWDAPGIIETMYSVNPTATPAHLQWTSNALLRLSWAKRILPDATSSNAGEYSLSGGWSTIPLNAVLNRLLASCIFLGWPIGEEVLKIQDKSCAILYPCLPSYSLFFLAVSRNRSYLNCPEQSSRQSAPLILDAISSHTCYAT